ncbi:MAG: hypothetical protein EBS19_13145, partial [Spirochaetia bacterium]|nr:hypothetical protein [Spirochaetia bacterium]
DDIPDPVLYDPEHTQDPSSSRLNQLSHAIESDKNIEKNINNIKSIDLEQKEIDSNKNITTISKANNSFDLVTYFISKIPEKYADVLGGQLNGKTEKVISEELGISRGTVKSRASRGKEFIRRLIQRGVIEDGNE